MSTRLHTLSRAAILGALFGLLFAAPVYAQTNTVQGNLDVQNFQPIPGQYGIFSVESSGVSSDLQVSGGLLLNFASEPLVLVPENGESTPLVDQQLAMDVLFNIGLFDKVDVGLALPVYLVNDATLAGNALDGATIGDLRLKPKLRILNHDDSPVGLGFFAQVGFPTGDDTAFTSSGTFYVRPGVIVDTKINRLLLSANLATNIQEEREFANLDVSSALTYGAGAQYEIVEETFLVGAEVFGSSSFDDFFSAKAESPVEGLLGAKYRTPIGINIEVGGGGGLVSGYGAPAYRVFGGLRYGEYSTDWDKDGIANSEDECPREPEDRDEFEDENGCPDPDNDQDTILDGDDDCPNEAEDMDEFEDADGCPDPDNDKDGIPDIEDECPMVFGVAQFKGCPDTDGDGIPDSTDKCPEEKGIASLEGCPANDKDGDGIKDTEDKCPEVPEDKDGFEDEDGCPDYDNDKDGVCDPWIIQIADVATRTKTFAMAKCQKADSCPLKAGPIETNGCPADVKAVFVGGKIQILDKVYFKTGKADIQKKSFELLNQVAKVIQDNPQLLKIEVQGHTDDVGSDAANLKLSQDRSNSVRQYLVGKGVATNRLVNKGYGETKPAKAIKGLRGRALKAARSDNRRVQFEILEQQTKKVFVPKGQ